MINFKLITNEIRRRINFCDRRIIQLKNEMLNYDDPEAEIYREELRKQILKLEIQRNTFKFIIGELPETELVH